MLPGAARIATPLGLQHRLVCFAGPEREDDVAVEGVRYLEIGQPLRAVGLIVRGIRCKAAELAVPPEIHERAPAVPAPVASEAQAVARLSALDAPAFNAIEEYLIESGELRRSRDFANDLRARVVVACVQFQIAGGAERDAVGCCCVDAVGARIDRVGEEPGAVGAEGRQP